jgi:uncharacterized protein
MKKIFSLFIVVGLLFVYGCGLNLQGDSARQNAATGPAVVLDTAQGKKAIAVEIADTVDERATGLMYRKSLPEDFGMFFIFDKSEPVRFWMKNTLVPLDMVFFDSDYQVIKMQKAASPCEKDPCPIYYSEKPTKYVLEVPGGMCDKMGLKEGDKAELKI